MVQASTLDLRNRRGWDSQQYVSCILRVARICSSSTVQLAQPDLAADDEEDEEESAVEQKKSAAKKKVSLSLHEELSALIIAIV